MAVNPKISGTMSHTLTLIILSSSLLSVAVSQAVAPSFATPGHLNTTVALTGTPTLETRHNDTMKYTLLTSPNGVSEFGLLVQTKIGAGNRPACSAVLINSTSYVMWASPCPPVPFGMCMLVFNASGDLELHVDGSLRWSTDTSSKAVGGLRMTDESRLQVLNKSNRTVWDSADRPTNGACLLPLQPPVPVVPAAHAGNVSVDNSTNAAPSDVGNSTSETSGCGEIDVSGWLWLVLLSSVVVCVV